MNTLEILALVFTIGLLLGAYGHKWLAKVTAAPANIAPAVAIKAVETVASGVVKKL